MFPKLLNAGKALDEEECASQNLIGSKRMSRPVLYLPHIVKIGNMLDKISSADELQFFFEASAWKNFSDHMKSVRQKQRGRLGGPISKNYGQELMLGRGISFDYHTQQSEFLKVFEEGEGSGGNWDIEPYSDKGFLSDQKMPTEMDDPAQSNKDRLPRDLALSSPMPQAYKRKLGGSNR